jgi:endonuclease YncB( thermonuclease family)
MKRQPESSACFFAAVLLLVTMAVLTVVVQGQTPKLEKQTDGTVAILQQAKAIDADTLSGTVMMIAEEGEPLLWNVETDARPVTVYLTNQRIRVWGIDAYELSDKPHGLAAKKAVEELLKGSVIWLTPRGKDNFGRLLAVVTLVDDAGNEIVLADWLITHGHGVEYRR